MQRLLIVFLFLFIAQPSFAMNIESLNSSYIKISKIKSLKERRKAFDQFYQNLLKTKDPNDPVKFLAFASMKDVFHGTKASSLNANRCRGLYQKMEEGYYPRRGVASAPRYLYPTIAFVDLICKN
ncbi:MAG: hypothetical protein VX642_09205 [Bdellovibrionota bacterium]|nr:hypothetical protein [Bdellovibrionota bacterium]